MPAAQLGRPTVFVTAGDHAINSFTVQIRTTIYRYHTKEWINSIIGTRLEGTSWEFVRSRETGQ